MKRPSVVNIVCCPEGPMLVRGCDSICDDNGTEYAVNRPVVAVCRCGKSARKPWCDGTHKFLRAGRRW